MRAPFQGCQGPPDHQTVSTLPQYHCQFLRWCCIAVPLPGQVAFPSTTEENIQDLRNKPWTPTESWLFPALALPDPCFPQSSCFRVRKFISQASVRWPVKGGRGWEQEKQQLWSQGWQFPIPQGFNYLQIYKPEEQKTASCLGPALPQGQGAPG